MKLVRVMFHNLACITLIRTFKKIRFIKWLGCPYPSPTDVQAYRCLICHLEIFASKRIRATKEKWMREKYGNRVDVRKD